MKQPAKELPSKTSIMKAFNKMSNSDIRAMLGRIHGLLKSRLKEMK